MIADDRRREPDAGDGARIRVLIVDDTDHVRDMLAEMLRLDGFEIAGEAASGHVAIELARSAAPDVIVMDLKMPGLDGISATAEIRTFAPTIPVILYTAYLDHEIETRAKNAGVTLCIGKIEGIDSLEREISALCMDLFAD